MYDTEACDLTDSNHCGRFPECASQWKVYDSLRFPVPASLLLASPSFLPSRLFSLQVTVLGMGLRATATVWDQLRQFTYGGSGDEGRKGRESQSDFQSGYYMREIATIRSIKTQKSKIITCKITYYLESLLGLYEKPSTRQRVYKRAEESGGWTQRNFSQQGTSPSDFWLWP